MHHQDITLIGAADEIAALRAALTAAGARHLAASDRMHLEWCSEDGPAPVEDITAAHPDVDVALRRFEVGSDAVDELTVCAGRVRIDRRRRIFREDDGAVSVRWGLCCDEDGERLDPALLRRVGDEILLTEHDTGPGRLSSAIFDALLLAEHAGRFARVVDDPFDDDAPSPRALDELRALASVALTVGCSAVSVGETELRTSRRWRMHEVLVHAGYEELWSTPGDASWPEWAGNVLTTLTSAIEACIDCRDAPVWVDADEVEDPHAWHPDRHRDAALGGLVSTCVQALALFADHVVAR